MRRWKSRVMGSIKTESGKLLEINIMTSAMKTLTSASVDSAEERPVVSTWYALSNTGSFSHPHT